MQAPLKDNKIPLLVWYSEGPLTSRLTKTRACTQNPYPYRHKKGPKPVQIWVPGETMIFFIDFYSS